MNSDFYPRSSEPGDASEAAARVVAQLQAVGHIAYFAGGCVRDFVMGRVPQDYDIATSATPEEVAALFRRTRLVGAKFGVVLVRIQRRDIEVATFRTDHEYADGRRPSGVTFSSPQEDALRRDFTINGMFLDPVRNEIIDYVGGQDDIAARVIRAIGDPDRRFAEDHLRLLRAIRFAGRFGFRIDAETWTAMCRHAPEIARISPERIRMELEAILGHPSRADAFRLLHDSGLLVSLWPGAAACVSWLDPIIARLRALPDHAGFELAMATILSEQGESSAVAVLEALHCSNQCIARVRWLLRHQNDLNDPSTLSLADLKLLMADPGFNNLMDLFRATLIATENPIAAHVELMRRVAEIPPDAINPPPFVTGDDLKTLGFTPGPGFKKVLDAVYRAQLDLTLNSKADAIEMARELAERT